MGKNLFVGFLDYEKAFDYANRAGILTCLMNDRCGSGIVKAISNMFTTSTYFPKSNKNYLCNGITTDYGVTQGRRSSGSFFSYYVSDMPKALNDIQYNDFMDPLSLAQLADDTAIYVELIDNLIVKFRKIFKYSREKKQVPNVKETYYKNLQGNYGTHEREERERRIRASENSMCKIYCDLDCISKCQIYNSMLTDYYRTPISRWRLSNHRLQIEVGRYTKPKTPRMDRVCSMCNILEDEQHVIFACPRYQRLREKYKQLIDHNDVRKFLNPNYQNMEATANFIRDIETRRTELKLT